MSQDLDLGLLVPEAAFEDPRCFDSHRYWEWEQEVATPHIIAAGFTIERWYSLEADSFGPLIRAVDVKKDDVLTTYFYG